MKLVVDNGNTRAKVAVFSDDGEEVLLYNWQQPTLQDYQKLLSQYEIDAALICSVGAFSDEIFVFFNIDEANTKAKELKEEGNELHGKLDAIMGF